MQILSQEDRLRIQTHIRKLSSNKTGNYNVKKAFLTWKAITKELAPVATKQAEQLTKNKPGEVVGKKSLFEK